MYKSREIRWFFQEEKNTIAKWFEDRGKRFSDSAPRTDFYLPLPGKDDLNVKLREGNVELKQRQGEPVLYCLSRHATGALEEWVKWSFTLTFDDLLAHEIIREKKYDWLEVHKERLGVKLIANEAGALDMLDIKEQVPCGCQVEYTRLVVNEKEWFTFGAEWFGGEGVSKYTSVLEEIIGDTELQEKASYGYNAFLNKQLP